MKVDEPGLYYLDDYFIPFRIPAYVLDRFKHFCFTLITRLMYPGCVKKLQLSVSVAISVPS